MNRIFLVGSGPSLRDTPINNLGQEDVMVMNKYGRMAKYHNWKISPKYYFKIDHNTVDLSHKEEIMWGYDNCQSLYLWEMFKNGYPLGHPNYDTLSDGVGDLENTTWIKKCEHTVYQWDNVKAVTAWHLPELCTAFGGMSTMIQIAVMLGYDEIYLLGCDLNYTSDVNKNHAIPDYTTDKRDKSTMDNGNMLALHKMAKRCSPVPIYNASLGGQLEVYKRVNLKDIL